MHLLIWIAGIYLIIGILLTAFCVHMSYHEAAIGFGDSDDLKAQKVLESRIGLVAVLFLFVLWPLAIWIAFRGKNRPDEQAEPPTALEQSEKATRN